MKPEPMFIGWGVLMLGITAFSWAFANTFRHEFILANETQQFLLAAQEQHNKALNANTQTMYTLITRYDLQHQDFIELKSLTESLHELVQALHPDQAKYLELHERIRLLENAR